MATSIQVEMLQSVNAQLLAIQPTVEQGWMAAQTWNQRPIMEAAFRNGLMMPLPRVGEKTYKWRIGPSTTANLTLDVSISDATGTEFDVSPIARVTPMMLIRFDDEIVRVVSVNSSGGTCEVVRGYCGTTAATHSSAITGYIMGQVPPEGGDPGESRSAFGTTYTNYGHRLEKDIKITDEAIQQPKLWAGREGSLDFEIPRCYTEMGDELANALWWSVATAEDNEVRVMNGFRAQIATNLFTSVGDLLFSDVDAAILANLNASGIAPDTLWCGNTLGTALAVWGGARIATTQFTGQVGGALQAYQSQIPGVGPLTIRLDHTLAATEVLIGASSELHAGWLNVFSNLFAQQYPGAPASVGMRLEPFRTGSATTVQMLAMAACELGNEGAFSLLTGVTGIDSDGV